MSVDEVIKTMGPYTLVARRRPDACQGVIWSDGHPIFKTVGSSMEDVVNRLENHRAEHVAARLLENTVKEPTAELARKAFVALAPSQPENRLTMLRAHLLAQDRRISARQLAEAAGYASYGAANLQYGLLAAAFFEHLPTALPQRSDGTRIWTYALADAGNTDQISESEWIWKLKPYVAEGLLMAGLW